MEESIVFFGSGPVAAESLKLLSEDFTIEAVVTKPRPAHHHGSVPVLELAQKLELPVVEAANKAELSQQMAASDFSSRLAVLIDFGIIVGQDVIDSFELGIVNSHFSILPDLRGADPITFALLSGQQQTGVSLMLLVAKMDEGPVFAQGIYDIEPDDNAITLTEFLIQLSAGLLKTALPKYVTGEAVPRAQEDIAKMYETHPTVSYSRKLTKEDGILDFSKPAAQLEREIRAFAEWPKSRTLIGGHAVIITKSQVAGFEITGTELEVGKAFPAPDKRIGIPCGKGVLIIEQLKPAGKQDMSAEAFLNGYGKNL